MSDHGALGLEIDPGQTDDVRRRATLLFPTAEVTVLPDLAGLARHVIIQTGNSGTSR
jgi:hypothetical protein